ncbi:hypothetical protein SDRG_00638 [Saprolegnia diclina VS20]|uniref:Signal peptidase complex subunit 1 n=1 Tax=Saprolegnia diclina (strain VS20) TaxID=1156394 RepID=T0R5S9_SAPDV|nr:hypothetical protein SDRG_00638 [Saprolegnia diclina VS20]EQC41775.1 hypothetical protein SDRG_00638 [Saprolegnia diclina VS20]|eukprot:XP_008604344.1 hypothetical protein SDRG_00638 [Saprolegnia diclina VS20]
MVDYAGQALAEKMMRIIFIVFCTPAWIYGFFQQDFTYPLYAWGAACATAVVLTLPNWPYFNRNPIQWRPRLRKDKDE